VADLSEWLPLVLGGLIVVAICFKVFTDPKLNNYIGYAFAVAVLLCAMPTLQNFSYKGRLGEFQADMKGAVANQSANLGGDINTINKKLDAINAKLGISADASVAADPNYQKNKASEVLVFYAATAATQAASIRSYLLDLGYKSSSIYTDFSELGTDLPPSGSIRLVHTDATADIANAVRAELRAKFPALKEIGDKVLDKMNSGQVQVELF
jgi:hypothetical protein